MKRCSPEPRAPSSLRASTSGNRGGGRRPMPQGARRRRRREAPPRTSTTRRRVSASPAQLTVSMSDQKGLLRGTRGQLATAASEAIRGPRTSRRSRRPTRAAARRRSEAASRRAGRGRARRAERKSATGPRRVRGRDGRPRAKARPPRRIPPTGAGRGGSGRDPFGEVARAPAALRRPAPHRGSASLRRQGGNALHLRLRAAARPAGAQ